MRLGGAPTKEATMTQVYTYDGAPLGLDMRYDGGGIGPFSDLYPGGFTIVFAIDVHVGVTAAVDAGTPRSTIEALYGDDYADSYTMAATLPFDRVVVQTDGPLEAREIVAVQYFSSVVPTPFIEVSDLDLAPVNVFLDSTGFILNLVQLDGDDEVRGAKLHGDRIETGTGDDYVEGLGGNDTVLGGAGDDTVFGGSGRDVVKGGRGADVVEAGGGRDKVIGGGGADLLFGDGGRDRLVGDGGRDRLSGDAGHDVLEGGGGKDKMRGKAGNDVLDGGKGGDVMKGFGGEDTFVVGPGDGRDVVRDFKAGVDKIAVNGGPSKFRKLDLAQDGSDVVLDHGRRRDELRLEDVDLADLSRGDFIL